MDKWAVMMGGVVCGFVYLSVADVIVAGGYLQFEGWSRDYQRENGSFVESGGLVKAGIGSSTLRSE
jgi:hypothetical protein